MTSYYIPYLAQLGTEFLSEGVESEVQVLDLGQAAVAGDAQAQHVLAHVIVQLETCSGFAFVG